MKFKKSSRFLILLALVVLSSCAKRQDDNEAKDQDGNCTSLSIDAHNSIALATTAEEAHLGCIQLKNILGDGECHARIAGKEGNISVSRVKTICDHAEMLVHEKNRSNGAEKPKPLGERLIDLKEFDLKITDFRKLNSNREKIDVTKESETCSLTIPKAKKFRWHETFKMELTEHKDNWLFFESSQGQLGMLCFSSKKSSKEWSLKDLKRTLGTLAIASPRFRK